MEILFVTMYLESIQVRIKGVLGNCEGNGVQSGKGLSDVNVRSGRVVYITSKSVSPLVGSVAISK